MLSRWLGIIAAFGVLSLVAFAPASAQAHAGHPHASVEAQPSRAPAVSAEVSVSRQAVAEMRVHATSAIDPHGTVDCADRGCCGSGHCAGCCSVLVPALAAEFIPPSRARELTFDAPTPPGLATDGPPRPPRTVA